MNRQRRGGGGGSDPFNQKLVIITSSLSVNKAENIEGFSSVFYLSLDSPPEDAQFFIDHVKLVLSIDDTEFFWVIDTKNPMPANGFISLSDGIYNCVQANNPKFNKLTIPGGSKSFSAGNLLQQMRRMIVLVKNDENADNPVDLLKSGKEIDKDKKEVFLQTKYSVVKVEAVNMGNFTVENGTIELVLVRSEIPMIVFAVAAGILAVLLIIFIVSIGVAVKKAKIRMRPVYQIAYYKSGRDSGKPKAYICKKCNRKKEDYFESGVPIKEIVKKYMSINDNLDEKVVGDFYPRIVYREDKEAWFIEYNEETITFSGTGESVTGATEEYDIFGGNSSKEYDVFGGNSSTQPNDSYGETTEESMPKDEPVTGSIFKIKRIFKNDLENKLVLTRIEY